MAEGKICRGQIVERLEGFVVSLLRAERLGEPSVDLARRGIEIRPQFHRAAIVPFGRRGVAPSEIVAGQAFGAGRRVERVRILVQDPPEERHGVRVLA